MTTLTIIAIMLAFLLGSAIGIAMRQHNIAKGLRIRSKIQKERIKAYQDANCKPNAFYSVKRVCTTNPEYEKYNGCWAVCRMVSTNSLIIMTTIKVFTDEDDEFNHNEALELCEKLCEK